MALLSGSLLYKGKYRHFFYIQRDRSIRPGVHCYDESVLSTGISKYEMDYLRYQFNTTENIKYGFPLAKQFGYRYLIC